MQPLRIESKPSLRLAGFQAPFISYLAPDTDAGHVIGPLWHRLIPRIGELPCDDPARCYGHTWSVPEAERSRPDELLYLAGVSVDADAPIPEGFDVVETAATLYAVFEHRGPITGLGETLQAIHREWLPGSGYRGNGRGDVDMYDERWSPDGEDSILEYWVGIERA